MELDPFSQPVLALEDETCVDSWGLPEWNVALVKTSQCGLHRTLDLVGRPVLEPI